MPTAEATLTKPPARNWWQFWCVYCDCPIRYEHVNIIDNDFTHVDYRRTRHPVEMRPVPWNQYLAKELDDSLAETPHE